MLSDPNSQAVMDNRSRCFYSNPLNYLLGGEYQRTHGKEQSRFEGQVSSLRAD